MKTEFPNAPETLSDIVSDIETAVLLRQEQYFSADRKGNVLRATILAGELAGLRYAHKVVEAYRSAGYMRH